MIAKIDIQNDNYIPGQTPVSVCSSDLILRLPPEMNHIYSYFS